MEPIIGRLYQFDYSGACDLCGAPIHIPEYIGTYLGKYGEWADDVFVNIAPYSCLGCKCEKHRVKVYKMLDVTKEFEHVHQ